MQWFYLHSRYLAFYFYAYLIDPGFERKDVAGDAGGLGIFGLLLELSLTVCRLGGTGIGETGAELVVDSLTKAKCWL